LLDDDGDPAVFAVRNGKAARVSVKLGYMDGEWVEIREGLKPGDGVVTAGKIALRDGTPVEVIGDAKKKTAAKVEVEAAGKKQ
ncbi:MAG: efflux RND transporter periplasmic adaptor subunit, partial [Pseudoxanthomonas sp.]